MNKRGKILRDTNAGPGLIAVEGQRYPFTLEEMWVSDDPPRVGMTVDVEFDGEAHIRSVRPVPESQLAKESATAAWVDVSRHSGGIVSGIKKRFGTPTIVALIVLFISWVYLPALMLEMGFAGVKASFWTLLGYIDAANTVAAMGQGPNAGSAGFWGVLAFASLLGPILPIVWKDRKAVLGSALPLLFMIVVLLTLRSEIASAFQAAGKESDDMMREVWGKIHIGIGLYAAFAAGLFLAFKGVRRYFSEAAI